MPLKMKQQLQLKQKSKELLYECQKCPQRHIIKEMLRWPVNTVIDAYLKEMRTDEGSSAHGQKGGLNS